MSEVLCVLVRSTVASPKLTLKALRNLASVLQLCPTLPAVTSLPSNQENVHPKSSSPCTPSLPTFESMPTHLSLVVTQSLLPPTFFVMYYVSQSWVARKGIQSLGSLKTIMLFSCWFCVSVYITLTPEILKFWRIEFDSCNCQILIVHPYIVTASSVNNQMVSYIWFCPFV